MADRKPNRADAVRQAVEDAFQTAAGQAQVSRGRAQDLVDELSGAAGRLRDVLEELRPPTGDDLAGLRAEVRTLSERVARLEAADAAPSSGSSSPRPSARGRGPGGPKSGSGKSGPRQGGGGAAKRPSSGKAGSGGSGSGAKGAGRRRPPKG